MTPWMGRKWIPKGEAGRLSYLKQKTFINQIIKKQKTNIKLGNCLQ